jgi:GTP cyclohydrolase IA
MVAIDRAQAEAAIDQFLRALGFDPSSHEDLRDTPARVTEAFSQDMLAGYAVDLTELVAQGSMPCPSEQSGMVAITDISVATLCPHHLMPALGKAHVAYLPGDRLLGLGTISALVDAYARRLTLQERIGENVARALIELAGARGAYCELVLSHGCLSARGTRQTDAVVRSVARLGQLAGSETSADLLLALGRSQPLP